MKKALLLCFGATFFLIGMDKEVIKKEKRKTKQLKVLDKKLLKIDQQYKNAKRKKIKKKERAFLYGQLLVASRNLANEYLSLAKKGQDPALSKVYICEEIRTQISKWAKGNKISIRTDYKLSCNIFDVIVFDLEKKLAEDIIPEETLESILRDLDQLIIRSKSLFSLADVSRIEQKTKLLILAEKKYKTMLCLFNTINEKTDDERADQGAKAIALMISKIEHRKRENMSRIIIE